jgi:hypothetical protein
MMLAYIKLANGEELLGDFTENKYGGEGENDNFISGDCCVDHPCRLLVDPAKGGMLLAYPTESLRLLRGHILFLGIPVKELASDYARVMGAVAARASGIALLSKQLITP